MEERVPNSDVYTVIRGGYRAVKGRRKSPQDKFLSRAELETLFRKARADGRVAGADAYALFALAGNFGLRSIEALSLELDHFKTLSMGYFRVWTAKKKGAQDDRVYVGRKGVDAVRQILDGRRARSRDVLFPFTTRTARYLFAFYAERAGISPNVSFHALRHTAARMMLQAIKGQFEYPERIVQAFLRHKPTTTGIYLEPSPEDMMKAADLKGIVR